MKQVKCKRCPHKWYQRTPKKPVSCPKCKSPYWNRERRVKASKVKPAEVPSVV